MIRYVRVPRIYFRKVKGDIYACLEIFGDLSAQGDSHKANIRITIQDRLGSEDLFLKQMTD